MQKKYGGLTVHKKIFSVFALILTFLLAASCTAILPTTKEENKMIFDNLSYGEHERNVLDLVLPGQTTGDVGLILFIHGGAWIMGDKSEYSTYLHQYAADLQLATAAINYRFISDSIHIEDILVDIDAALQTIRQTAAEQGININKVLLTGMSAGAHLSMLYAYRCKDTAPIRPAAVFSFCGPTDLYDDAFYVGGTLGTVQEICSLMSAACGEIFTIDTKSASKDALDAVSPLTYVGADVCPTAICHGEKDSVVPYSNALRILDAFEQHGIKYDFISFPNSDHDLGSDPDCMQQAFELLTQYAQTYLK